MPHRHAVYVIDARDRVASVNEVWTDFAAENGAPGLADRVLGQVLWRFIEGEQTESIYRALFQRVREGRTITFPYRCDAPSRVREFELELAPQGDGDIVCTTHVLAERDRPPVRLIDPLAERSDAFLRMCGWCKRVEIGEWVDAEVAVERLGLFAGGPVPQVTHGICDECTARVLADV
jgi:hypothetical protein